MTLLEKQAEFKAFTDINHKSELKMWITAIEDHKERYLNPPKGIKKEHSLVMINIYCDELKDLIKRMQEVKD